MQEKRKLFCIDPIKSEMEVKLSEAVHILIMVEDNNSNNSKSYKTIDQRDSHKKYHPNVKNLCNVKTYRRKIYG